MCCMAFVDHIHQQLSTSLHCPPHAPPPPTGQNHNRSQEKAAALSRSSSDSESKRMSISSDTECPGPGPLCPSLPQQINPGIREEEAEGQPTPSAGAPCPEEEKEAEERSDGKVEADAGEGGAERVPQLGEREAGGAAPEGEARAGLNYDSVKYTLVVDEHAQLELGSLKDCLHGYNEHNDDSDAETVYQSANEEEDPDYEEERKPGSKAKNTGMGVTPPALLPSTQKKEHISIFLVKSCLF